MPELRSEQRTEWIRQCRRTDRRSDRQGRLRHNSCKTFVNTSLHQIRYPHTPRAKPCCFTWLTPIIHDSVTICQVIGTRICAETIFFIETDKSDHILICKMKDKQQIKHTTFAQGRRICAGKCGRYWSGPGGGKPARCKSPLDLPG